jgi:hypothetical protein
MFGQKHKNSTTRTFPQKERRWMQRIPVSNVAFICGLDDAYLQCTITSINANGMLIVVENTELYAGCDTTIEWLLECEDGYKYQSESVRVVHADHSHVAVAFVEYNCSHMRMIQKLLQAANLINRERYIHH